MQPRLWLWMGEYNWHGEVHTLWTHAPKKSKAHSNFIGRLARKLGRTRTCISNHFLGDRDNFKITKKEKENGKENDQKRPNDSLLHRRSQ